MKRYISNLIRVIFLLVSINATAQQTSLTIDNQSPGWLSSKIGYGDQQTVENLKVIGYLNGVDLKFLEELKTKQKLKLLDLSDVSITEGGSSETYKTNDNEYSTDFLKTSPKLQKLITSKTASLFGNIADGIADTIILCGTEENCSVFTTPNSKSTTRPAPYFKYLSISNNTKTIYFHPGSYYSYIYYDGPTYFTGTIVLPPNVNYISGLYIDGGTIISYVEDPLTVTIESSGLERGLIYVPKDTKELYEKSVFKKLSIKEMAPPSEIQLNKNDLKLFKGDTDILQPTLIPQDAFYKELIWETSDENIVAVSQSGDITAVNHGVADITVSSVKNPDVKAICKVSVFEHTTGVEISSAEKNIDIGKTITLSANTLPLETSDNEIIWSSDKDEIATVDKEGNVTGIKIGDCIIKATSVDGGYVAECKVTVVQPANSISLDNKKISVIVGNTETLTATIKPDDTTDKTVLWSSDDTGVAEVDKNGIVTAKKAGKCTITATAKSNADAKATCEVTVIQPVTGITLSESSLTMTYLTEMIQLTANVWPEDATNKAVKWLSSDISVCSVSDNGTVVATGYGQASVVATTVDGGFPAACLVKVIDSTEIKSVALELDENVRIYDIWGNRNNTLKRGLNIVKMSDGTTKKVVMK